LAVCGDSDSKQNFASAYIASLGASPQNLGRAHLTNLPPTTTLTFTLALDVGAPGAVASPMAQPNAEPVEDYECVAALPLPAINQTAYCRRMMKC